MGLLSIRVLPLLTLAVVSSACTSTSAGSNPPATGGANGGSHDGAHQVASLSAPRTPWSSDSPPEEHGTHHHFQPRAHEPHFPARVGSPPSLGSLPRFVDGSHQCFPQPVYRDHYYPPPRPQPYSSGNGYGAGHGRLGGSHKSAPRPAPSSAPRRAESADASGPRSAPQPAAAPQVRQRPAERSQPEGDPGLSALRGHQPRDDDAEQAPYPRPHQDGGYGAAIYLSNDDTMSLSSAQRLIYAIDQVAPLRPEQIRPHELLNYFSFDTAPVPQDHDFSVVASAGPSSENPGLWSLGFAVQGRPLTLSTRRNANLSFVIDRSGSMQAEGRMEYVKQGLLTALDELKTGDIVNVSLFDSTTCQLAQNFVVGRDPISTLASLIRQIEPRGSTNLYDGLTRGYDAADRAYRPEYTNRVVMITDANTNTGVTDERLISLVGKHYDARRIRLSGVGVGRDFNDSLLDRLTERGKGAYVFLGSNAEVDAVFGPRFVSLIETVANDVHFKLSLPPSLEMDTFYGEEASTVKERVQAIHYFANTSQMFLSDLRSQTGQFPGSDDVMLTVEYQDPETGDPRVEEFSWKLGDLMGDRGNIDKAQLVNTFATRLSNLASRPLPHDYGHERHSWVDPEAVGLCDATRQDLGRLGASIGGDPEVARVQQLWDTYCARYQPLHVAYRRGYDDDRRPPEPPLRVNEYAPRDTWPAAVR